MPSCTIASIRAWPNAPRDCLLASTSRSVVTCEVRSVRFLWALSMMPRRSCSTRSESMVLRVVCSIDAAGGLALRAEHFAQALFEFVGANGLRHRKFRAAPAGPRDDDGNDQQQ